MAFEISLKTLLRRKNYPEDEDTYSATHKKFRLYQDLPRPFALQFFRKDACPRGPQFFAVCVDLPVLSPKSGNVMYFFT